MRTLLILMLFLAACGGEVCPQGTVLVCPDTVGPCGCVPEAARWRIIPLGDRRVPMVPWP